MHITKKFDRAFQWAGEKMGGEAKSGQTDEFRMLEAEMNLRQQGTERLQKSTNSYIRWMTRRCDALEDRERAAPIGYHGRVMAAHGEEFEADSQLGTSLVALGQAHEQIAVLQEGFVEQANATWVENLERNNTMMKEYQTARKKLENRRLAYDASTAKMQKARRDDFRVEEEVRTNKAKFEESTEDVYQRMVDIKEAEADNVAAITDYLDAELDYYERCAEELRRARQNLVAGNSESAQYRMSPPRSRSTRCPPAVRRVSTARSWQDEEPAQEPEPLSARMRNVSPGTRAAPPPPPQSTRPAMGRSITEGRATQRSGGAPPPLPLSRVRTDGLAYGNRTDDIFDDRSASSGSGSPDYPERTLTPATSYGSLTRTISASAVKKAPPPPPPVNRAKKPAPPPVPTRRDLRY
ncbi:unnamed protein product [Clonostachys rhizophaga]|uniref:BAR domain-containing protein n=1 Tax=Clonostachys rhizophaga TaxID=160324 RepID=A0A9N9W2E7_9HYPO|nr:unnamed protein product [Clonostachys rhizophaga]